jgi:TRAP-type C4-dicarboxylate transport system permease small subunit
MNIFIDTVRRLSVLCGIVSVLLLMASVVVVCHLVIVRYALGESTIWQHEFVTFALIGSTFLGSPYVLLTKGHVNVDLLPIYMGHRGRLALALLSSLLSLGFCLIIAWTGLIWWEEAWAGDWHNETVWAPPLWIPYIAMPLGMALLSLQYVADIASILTGREMPFGLSPEEKSS